jgi:hypothetical protein
MTLKMLRHQRWVGTQFTVQTEDGDGRPDQVAAHRNSRYEHADITGAVIQDKPLGENRVGG